MKHKILAGLTAFAMAFAAVPVMALPDAESITVQAASYTEVTEGCLTYRVYSTYATVYKYDNTQKEVVIPDTVQGLPVISIADYAFAGTNPSLVMSTDDDKLSKLEKVTFPAGLISIGGSQLGGAFSYCINLKSVELPDSVTDIGDHAFRDCTSLASVKLPAYLTEIQWCTFSGCTSLRSIEFPAALETIGQEAFHNTGLTEVTVPGHVKTLKHRVFSECANLKSAVIEEGVEKMKGGFHSCPALETVSLPGTITVESDGSMGLFQDCTSLTSVNIAEGANLAKADSAFKGCTSLKTVHLPSGTTSITASMFYGCTALTALTIPSACTNIGVSAFEGCTALTSFVIPESVKSVDYNAFKDCARLESLTIMNKDCSIQEKMSTNTSINDTICSYNLNGKCYFNGVLYVQPDSKAQQFAEKYGYHYEYVGTPSPGITMGDLNADGVANASDAAKVLIAAAAAGAGGGFGLTDEQMQAADVNNDGTVNASDAALILIYSAAVGAGYHGTLPEFFAK